MEKFVIHDGIVAPLDRPNIDTDAIIPKQFLKSIKRTGFGPHLFDEWRYLDHGEPGMDCANRRKNPDFVLNNPRYDGTTVLLTRRNFGCGSSREHAPWALQQYGFRAILAPSFADIFFNNCFKIGLVPIVLPEDTIDKLFTAVKGEPGYRIRIDLERQAIQAKLDGKDDEIPFSINEFRRDCLLNGLDDISLTLQNREKIKAFEEQRLRTFPWLTKSLS